MNNKEFINECLDYCTCQFYPQVQYNKLTNITIIKCKHCGHMIVEGKDIFKTGLEWNILVRKEKHLI
jgi:hypothetical protein